jgi:hypothetical protein
MKELLDDERIKIAILAFIAGVILAFIVYPRPEQETVYKFETKVETDTVYKEIKDTVYIPKTKIKTEVLRDTILVDYKPTINSFSTINTITNTETKTIIQKPKGIYVGAGINSLLDPAAKVAYLDNKYLFQYQYQPVTKIHSLGISKKLF